MLDTLAEAATTSLGFFWKSGWAFVFGYAISGMIQAFVPRDRPVACRADASRRRGLATAAFICEPMNLVVDLDLRVRAVALAGVGALLG